MQIAISTDGNNVSAHFGRCPNFTIVWIEKGKVIKKQIIANPGHSPGLIPEFLHEQGVEVIVAGGMGKRASDLFDQFGVRAVLGVSGSVDEAIVRFIEGKIKGNAGLCRPGSGKGYGIEKTKDKHSEDNRES